MFSNPAIQKCTDLLCYHQQTIALAESVTAGLLQAAFASAENAAMVFQGGITAYNTKQKYTHLHVEPLHAISCNCVSETVAAEMALGVNSSFSSDWAIGITGYASNLPGHDMNELYACYAISYKHAIITTGKITSAIKEPLQVQLWYVDAIMNIFLQTVINMNDQPQDAT